MKSELEVYQDKIRKAEEFISLARTKVDHLENKAQNKKYKAFVGKWFRKAGNGSTDYYYVAKLDNIKREQEAYFLFTLFQVSYYPLQHVEIRICNNWYAHRFERFIEEELISVDKRESDKFLRKLRNTFSFLLASLK